MERWIDSEAAETKRIITGLRFVGYQYSVACDNQALIVRMIDKSQELKRI